MARATGLFFSLISAFACGPSGAPEAQRTLLREQVPRIKEVIQQDRQRHWQGVQEAARRLRRGFLVEDRDIRERQMRRVLVQIQEPPRGIGAFIVSPMTFLAAIDRDGIVIARDSDEDYMKDQDFEERYPVVRAALQGEVGMQLGEFAALEEGAPPSYSIMFAAPARYQGEITGAVVAGIPLWREAQRLSRQLRVDAATQVHEGLALWVYLYKGDRVFYSPEAPPELLEYLPDEAARNAGLQRSPGGFTGEFHFYRRWYGYAVIPIPTLGEDIGMIALRSDIPS